MRSTLEDCSFDGMTIRRGLRMLSADWVPADNEVLDPDAPPLLIMRPAGAIDVLMPTSSDSIKGLTFHIMNASANVITLKTDGDAAFTQAIAIAGQQMCIVTCTGSATQASGWRAMCAAGTQTSP